jgi:hypothetical protein
MPQNEVYDLLKILEMTLDDGFSISKYAIVNKREIETLIDRIYAALPPEVQEARVFMKRKEELQNEAQQQAAKIVQDAQNEANRLISESEIRKAIERDGIRLKNEVVAEMENIKHVSMQDAEQLRLQATEESMKIREGAELYAKQVLTSLEDNLTQLQQVVKNGQIYMEQIKNDSSRYAQQANPRSNGGWTNNKDAKKL